MNVDKYETFRAEFDALLEKHGMKHCAFCGQDAENHYLGFLVTKSYGEHLETSMNIGRLYQHIRGVTRDLLDRFEKEKSHELIP